MVKKTFLFLFTYIFFSFHIITAGTTGKIAGRITGTKGEGLQGVNVFLKATSIGVATNENGYYTLLNVPPGRYFLSVSMIGYAKVTFENVIVVMDRTTTIDINLQPEAIQLSEVIVEAENPMVIPDISASQLNIQSDQINNLPISNITQAIGLQAGIEGLTIRGGSQRETAFLVDGFLRNDERSNNPYTSISLNSISEIQVQTGGFNAEYGNIRSGVINVITKEGDRAIYHGAITFRRSPPAPKHFGKSIYDPDSYFLRPYLDPVVCWTGTNKGEPFEDLNFNSIWDEGEPFSDFNGDGTRTYWDSYTQRQYSDFEGWNSIAEVTTKDDNPNNDLTPSAAQEIFKWQHRRSGNITEPDYTIDFAFGGPVPLLSNQFGDLRFHLSHQKEKEMFVFPLSRNGYSENITDLKITADITSQMKLTMMSQYGEIHSVSPYTWKTTPTGSVLRTTYEVANLTNSSNGNAILFMPGFYSPASIYRTMIGIKLNHMLSTKTFYEFIIQHFINRYNTFQMGLRDTTKSHEVFPGYFADEAPFGYWGYGVTGIDGMILGGWMNLGRDRSINSTTLLRFDITSQVNIRNQVKVGIISVINDFKIRSSTENPGMSTWNRSLVYDVAPFRFEAYIQDKLEFEEFIANVGLRFEYSSANTDRYLLGDFDDYYSQGLGDLIEEEAPKEKSKGYFSISPRLGISHPITVNSKLYFNYGHFQSEPLSSYRFRLQREANGLVTHIGNPNLSLERTIAYEVGYSQRLLNNYLLNLSAYYKDITDQPGWIYYQNVNSSVQYDKAANNNYEDIRGLEFTLNKPYGNWITGFINYTYLVQTSGYFGYTEYYQDPQEMRDYLRINPYQSKPKPRPYFRINLSFHTPPNFGPVLAGIRPIGYWNFNIIGTYKTGNYATYNPNEIPGVSDNVQWKDRYNIDLRVGKSVHTNLHSMEIFVDVSNALNTKFLSYAGFSDYYDYQDYLESLNFSWEEGVEKGSDRIGEYRDWDIPYDPLEPNPDNDPEIEARNAERKKNKSYIDMPNFKAFTFLDPRKITVGVRINF